MDGRPMPSADHASDGWGFLQEDDDTLAAGRSRRNVGACVFPRSASAKAFGSPASSFDLRGLHAPVIQARAADNADTAAASSAAEGLRSSFTFPRNGDAAAGSFACSSPSLLEQRSPTHVSGVNAAVHTAPANVDGELLVPPDNGDSDAGEEIDTLVFRRSSLRACGSVRFADDVFLDDVHSGPPLQGEGGVPNDNRSLEDWEASGGERETDGERSSEDRPRADTLCQDAIVSRRGDDNSDDKTALGESVLTRWCIADA